jgi:flagellar protein FlaI
VLFQAISTGHGGLCTLHADEVTSAVQRLLSEPMNVPKAFLPFLDLCFVVRRISMPAPGGGFKSIRRVISIDEIISDTEHFQAFSWEARGDQFVSQFDKSPKLEKIAKDNGITVLEAVNEVERRALILKWMQQKGIRNFKELSPLLELYVTKPAAVYARAVSELESRGVAVPEITGASGA